VTGVSRENRRLVLLVAGSVAGIVLIAAVVTLLTAGPERADPRTYDPVVVAWEEPIEVATGEGHRGPWRMNDSDFRYVDDPAVALNDQGEVAIVWADQARQDLYFQRYADDGRPRFSDPVNVSRSGDTFSWLPRVIMAAGDEPEVFVLWQEIIFAGGSHGGEILFAASDDGGRSFSEPINLSRSPAGAGKGRIDRRRWHNGSLDLVRGPDGDLYAAWTEYEGRLRITRSTDGGQTFREPVTVAGEDGEPPARAPALAVDPGGEVHLAWAVGERQDADIHYMRMAADLDSLRAAETILSGPGRADAPALAVGSDGMLFLAYAESGDGSLADTAVLLARRGLDDGAFRGPQTVADPSTGAAHFPALALTADDRACILWERFPDPEERSVGLGFSCLAGHAQALAPSTIIPGTDEPGLGFNGSQQGLLMQKLALNAQDDVAVVNSRFLAGDSSRVRLFRGRLAPVP